MKILLLPGLDGTGKLFAPFQKMLPNELASYVCSLPIEGDQDPKSLAEFVATTYLPNEEVVLLAESFSGPVAYELIQRHGAKIKGVVFVSSFLTVPSPLLRLARCLPLRLFPWHWAPPWALRWFCVGSDASDTVVQQIQQVIASVPPSTITKRINVLSSLRRPRERIHIPCLYLQPTNDRLVAKWHATRIRSLCDDLNVQEIRGPHFLLQVNPEDCIAPVVDFMSVTAGRGI